mgnify:CR=1 FL=1
MASMKQNSYPLDDLTDEQLEELVKSNDALDQEQAKMIKEKIEEKEREAFVKERAKRPYKRLRKSPLEIINRSFFFVFLGSFLFSFLSVYELNPWWFMLYVISAFSCILYTPNRKALKELIDAWPNIKELLKNKLK